PLDDFDASIVPAVRTVHDADGTTRTLIYNGTVYYDAQDCCEARGVGSALQITRVMEDHPGIILGDEFDGMPPYLWDGNRYLLLTIENGRIVEVTKVYRIVRATDEERTLMATFTPSSLNPLEQTPTLEAVSTRARMTWAVPDTATLSALAKINGVPESDVQAIDDRLNQVGKAVWKSESESGVHIVSFELDTLGRLRLDRVDLDRKGFDGELATPAPPAPPPAKDKAKEKTPPGPAPLPDVHRTRQIEQELPLLQVTNNRKSAAEVRLADGTVIFVDAGQTAESIVSPGTWTIDVQFESGEPARMTGSARLAARARYTLALD
ncbi:MAG TPA: hypothetical protein VNI57_11180, partial [Candidatus Saccharimonadales bacterium]|nr:hypothetical protein [Candidatus Saccharimonadales bacterium]